MTGADLLRPWFEDRGWVVVEDGSWVWCVPAGEDWPVLVFSAGDDVYVCVEFQDYRLHCSVLRDREHVLGIRDFTFEPAVEFDLRRPDVLEVMERELVGNLLGLEPGAAHL